MRRQCATVIMVGSSEAMATAQRAFAPGGAAGSGIVLAGSLLRSSAEASTLRIGQGGSRAGKWACTREGALASGKAGSPRDKRAWNWLRWQRKPGAARQAAA
jgi:hypothetical protein